MFRLSTFGRAALRGRILLGLSLSGVPCALGQQGPAPSLGEESARPKLTRPPKLVQFVEAPYPESEKAAGQQASVVLQLSIGVAGNVESAQVLQSAGAAFDQAALAAVKQFVFEPAEIDHQPAPIRLQYRYDFVLQVAAPTTGSLEGVVRDRKSGAPLAGVRVELDDGTALETGPDGRFAFRELTPGARRVTLSRSDIAPLQTEEPVEVGQKLEATYEVELATTAPIADEDKDDLEIIVVAPALTKQVVSTKVDASQARRVAGTQGDVLKIVENLPGVARASAGSGQVVVWGAAAEDTRVYVDDVRVPLLYHFGGLRSVVQTDLVENVELIPGGYGASYGRGLGGLIEVGLRAPDEQRAHVGVQADLLDASVWSSGRASENVTFAAAARKSYLDHTLAAATDEDVGEYFPIPKYHDGQLRLRRNFGERQHVELGGLASSDEVSRVVSSADPAERKRETRSLDFQRVWLRFVSKQQGGAELRATPWLGRDDNALTLRFGATTTRSRSQSTSYGLRLNYAQAISAQLTLAVGLDLEAENSQLQREGSLSTPAREGDARVFGQPPSDQINGSDWSTLQASAAPFVELDFGLLGGQVHLKPGLRVEPYFISVDKRAPAAGGAPVAGVYVSEVTVQPRLAVRYAPSARASIDLAWGRYRQAPDARDESPVFGNPQLTLASGSHYLASSHVEIGAGLAAETTAFYSRTSGLAVRNPSPSPNVAEALLARGEGRAFGVQFLLRKELSQRWFGWLAYTLMRAERRDDANSDWRLFDFDQTHVLTALLSCDLGLGFDVGGRVRYATGYPRTPVIGSYFDSRRNLYEPVLGARNSIRIEDFAQFDVRLSKTFVLPNSRLELYADVQNVTNRENAEELVYDQNYSQRRSIHGLPVLPVVGARFEY